MNKNPDGNSHTSLMLKIVVQRSKRILAKVLRILKLELGTTDHDYGLNITK
jgi:hypothetical protein